MSIYHTETQRIYDHLQRIKSTLSETRLGQALPG